MSSVAVGCCGGSRDWPQPLQAMPSDVIYTISNTNSQLVMDQNERRAGAVAEPDSDVVDRSSARFGVRSRPEHDVMGTGDFAMDPSNAATLPVKAKFQSFQNRSTTYTSKNVIAEDYVDDGEEKPEKLEHIQELKSGLVVDLPSYPHFKDVPPTCKSPIPLEKSNEVWKSDSPNEKTLEARNNNKEEEDNADSCIVDCLYYSLQCCECSIM